MALRLGDRVFAPRGWALLLAGALVAGCVAAGYWQIGRAREKQALVEAFAAGGATVAQLRAGPVDAQPRYQRVATRGRLDSSRQVLLDNMPSSTGRPGYRVLTPLRRDAGERLLLVDRGWVPLGATRAALPDVAVTDSVREVRGRLDRLPEPALRAGPAATPGASGWPRVLNFPTQDDLEQAYGAPVESRILLLDPDLADGYERQWRPALRFGPERHLGYAIQWFALALALVVAFVALSLRRAADRGAAQ